MLKRKRLYREVDGQIWHVKSDGTMVMLPDFVQSDKPPFGECEEIGLNSWTRNISVSDNVYLAKKFAEQDQNTCIDARLVLFPCDDFNGWAFDIVRGTWVDDITNYALSPLVNLKQGNVYEFYGKRIKFIAFRSYTKTFMFFNGFKFIDVKIAQSCDIKEIPKHPKVILSVK